MSLNPRVLSRAAALVALSLLCVSPRGSRLGGGTGALPTALSDAAFWQLLEGLSEPGGVFRSDNLVSNEDTLQHVIPDLRRRLPPGGVYVGVGPEQNFTFIAALEPEVAFIVDVRRENLLLHLMYKAVIEASPTRAAFLSRLFSRSCSGEADTTRDLLAACEAAAPSRALYDTNLAELTDRLTRRHHFRLSASDLRGVASIYTAFFDGGPDLRYAMARGGFGGRFFPTYADLMLESDATGVQRGFLASDAAYQRLRHYELANLIVPVVGDFGGATALRTVGAWARAHGATVRLFYASNVEQYLFQGDAWQRFYQNLSALPVDSRSLLVRSRFNLRFRLPPTPYGARSEMRVDSIPSLLADLGDGRAHSYTDVLDRSR